MHRVVSKLPTRRPKERATNLPLAVVTKGEESLIAVDPRHHPGHFAMIAYGPPGLLAGRQPGESCGQVRVHLHGQDLQKNGLLTLLREQGISAGQIEWRTDAYTYARMLAKIAHAAAVDILGVDGFRAYLPKLILEKPKNGSLLPHYVGGELDGPPPQPGPRHHLLIRRIRQPERDLLIADVRLFANEGSPPYGTPIYSIVVGEREPTQGPTG